MSETSPVQVFVVKFHNPTSGKGSYHLYGVYWNITAAQEAIKSAPEHPGPRQYTIHRFTEHEQIQISEGW